tara:strand:- start:173398 stop:174813 length:1416 start_codon:yes stop_codon:yes gene_type:complete
MSGIGWDNAVWTSIGRWVIEPKADDQTPSGAAIDTRVLIRGQIFVAYVGERVDGHAYLSAAKSKGAAVCIVTDASKIPDGFDVPTLIVKNPTDAMTVLAAHWRSQFAGTVIGITGSNGKTTTTRLVYAVLSEHGNAWVSSKSHNNAIGVPMSVLNTPLSSDFAIFELGTSSHGEIAERAALVQPDIAVITSIGRAHLKELGSIDGVCAEKASILLSTKSRGIVPSGVEPLDRVISALAVSCEIERLDQSRLKNIIIAEQRVEFELDGSKFQAPVPGAHNASNAAMAVLVGRACGMDDADIARGLLNAKLPEMRLDRVEIPTKSEPIVIYNDAYNANPDSTRAALSFFESINPDTHKVIVLGDMLELGSSGPDEHASLVSELDSVQGRVVLVGPLYHAAAEGSAYERWTAIDDFTMTEVARSIKPGDVVLLKGSRGVGLERLVYILINRHTIYAKVGAKSGSTGMTEGTDAS